MSKDHRPQQGQDLTEGDQVALVLEVCAYLRGVGAGALLEELSSATNTEEALLKPLLDALELNKILRRDSNGQRYYPGHRLVELQQAILQSGELSVVAYPELVRLRDICGETVLLAQDDGHRAVNMGRALTQHDDMFEDEVGTIYPYHCTSSGKVIAAHLPEDRLQRYLSAPLMQLTDQSIRDRKALEQHLILTRERGYALNDEEYMDGNRAVGAPVFSPDGDVIGAVAISGPSYRMPRSRLPALVEELRTTARRITQKLARPKLTPRSAGSQSVLSKRPASKVMAPQWHKDLGKFVWVDQDSNSLWAGLPGQQAEEIKTFDSPIHTAMVTSRGQIVVVTPRRLINLSTGKETPLEDAPRCSVPGTANDLWGVVNRQGENVLVNFTMDGQTSDHAMLPQGVGSIAYCSVTGSLFLAFPDQGTIQSYNLITRHLKQVCHFPKATGRLGGMAIDKKWRLWVGFEGGWTLIRMSLNGTLQARYNMPLPNANGMAFGGAEGADLLITSQRDGLEEEVLEHAPLTGHALCCRFEE